MQELRNKIKKINISLKMVVHCFLKLVTVVIDLLLKYQDIFPSI